MDDADRAQQAGGRAMESAMDRYLRETRARLAARPVVAAPVCLACGEPIPADRLMVLPGACLCCGCQEIAEGAMGR